MTRTLLILITICFISCTNDEQILKTLDIAIEDKILANLQTINRMEMNVKDMGDRDLDVKVLNNSKELLQSRKQFGLPSKIEQFDSKFNISNALEFIDSLKNASTKWNYEIDRDLISNIKELSQNNSISEPIRNRLIYLDILKLESIYLIESSKEVGSECGLFDCFTFDLDTDADKVEVGDNFESILTVADRWLSKEILTYDSIMVTYEGIPIDFEQKQIGKAHFIKFKVDKKGTYKYSGVAVAEYEEFHELDYKITCDFEFLVVGN